MVVEKNTFLKSAQRLIGDLDRYKDGKEATKLVWVIGNALLALEKRWPDLANRAASAYLSYHIRRIECGKRRKSTITSAALRRFLGKRKMEEVSILDHLSHKYDCGLTGFLDHCSIWSDKKTKEVILVGEPYQLHLDGMRNLVRFCDDFGLDACISGHSQHFPGWTIMIEFQKREKKKSPDRGATHGRPPDTP